MWLVANAWNSIVALWNGLLAAADFVFDIVLGVVEWFLNAMNGGFDGFAGSCANLIGQIIGWFLQLGKVVTKIIDAIFDTNWTAGLESLRSKVTEWGKNDKAITLERDWASKGLSADGVNATDWYSDGYNFGEGVENGIKDFKLEDATKKLGELGKSIKGSSIAKVLVGKDPSSGLSDLVKALTGGFDNPAAKDYGKEIAKNTGATANNTSSLAKNSEHLGYMRQLAEREAINRFTSNNTKVEVTNNNKIDSKFDLDEVVNYMSNLLSNPRAAKTHV